MRDLASAATNFRQKPCKLSLISSKLESICKIKVGKYEIKLTVFKVLLFLLRFPTYFFSYLTSFVSIDRYNLNLLANLCNNYIHVTNTRSSWATYGKSSLLTYFGAWMPADNEKGKKRKYKLDESEVINFPKYFVTKVRMKRFRGL